MPRPRDAGPWTACAGGMALVARWATSASCSLADETPAPRAVDVRAGEDRRDRGLRVGRRRGWSRRARRGADARDVRRRLDEARLTASLGPPPSCSPPTRPGGAYRAPPRRSAAAGPGVVVGTRAPFAPVHDLGLSCSGRWRRQPSPTRTRPWHARARCSCCARRRPAPRSSSARRRARSGAPSSMATSGWARGSSAARRAAPPSAPARRHGWSDSDLARDEAARTGGCRAPRGRRPRLRCRAARCSCRCAAPRLRAGSRLPVLPPGRTVRPLPRPARGSQRARRPDAGGAGGWPATGGARAAAASGCERSGGERRTAEARSRLPRRLVRVSGRDPGGFGRARLRRARPSLVVATRGAGAARRGRVRRGLLLDGRLMLDRPDLRAAEEAVRRRTAAEPGAPGGRGRGRGPAGRRRLAVQAVAPRPGGLRRPRAAEREAAAPAARLARGRGHGTPRDVADRLSHTGSPPRRPSVVWGRCRPAGRARSTRAARACARHRAAPEGAALAAALREARGAQRAQGRRTGHRAHRPGRPRWSSRDRGPVICAARPVVPASGRAARQTRRRRTRYRGEPSVAVIRLFGDPSSPRRGAGDDVRQGAPQAGQGPHRHDARRARRRSGGPAARCQPPGVHLRRRRRHRPPDQPCVLDLSDEMQEGDEGCLSLPNLAFNTRRSLRVVAKGMNMHGEPVVLEGSELLARCIQHETDHLDGIVFIDRLDAETRKGGDERDPRTEWFGQPPAQVKVSPHRISALAVAACAWCSPARRTSPPPCGHCSTLHHGSSPSSPAPTRLRACPHPDRRRRSRPSPPSAASRSCARSGPPTWVPRPAARDRSRLLPVVAYGALVPRAALGIPRHGWVNLHSRCFRVAWRRARAARDLARRRRHRRHDLPVRGGARHRSGAGHGGREHRSARHQRRPAAAPVGVREPACSWRR